MTKSAHLFCFVLLFVTLVAPTGNRIGAAPTAPQTPEFIDPGDWHQENLSLAIDSDGNTYAAWEDYRNGGVPHIRFAFCPAGGSWQASLAVDPTGAGDQLRPTLAVDENHNAYLVWEDARGAVTQVYFAYRPAGGAWGGSQVVSPTAEAQIYPSLAVNGPGQALVAWSQGAFMARDVYAALRPTGGPWGAAERVSDATTETFRTAVALNDTGQAYALWNRLLFPAAFDVAFDQRPVGGAWGADETVNDAGTDTQAVDLDLAVDQDGMAHAVWTDNRNGDRDIYSASRPAGGPWSANEKVNDDMGSAEQWQPDVNVDVLGDILVVWVDQRNGTDDVYGAIREVGNPWGTNVLLAAAPAPPGKTQPGANNEPSTAYTGTTTNLGYTQDIGSGSGRTSGKRNATSVSVNPPSQKLDRIDTMPREVTIDFGATQQFGARGYDEDDKQVPISPIWSANGGTINTSGLYTGSEEGIHTVMASVPGSSVTGDATITVNPPSQKLDRIGMMPREVTIDFGGTQQFEATGYDQNDNPVHPFIPSWRATGGNINPENPLTASPAAAQALYTAGNLPGRYRVTAAVDEVAGHASVRITGAPPPDLPPGGAYAHTFTCAGLYPYHDRYHPALQGTVLVSPSLVIVRAGVTVPISITAAGFEPLSVTIGLSDTVRWTNTDTTPHAINGGLYYYDVFLPVVHRSE